MSTAAGNAQSAKLVVFSTIFAKEATQREAAEAFVSFLRSEAARHVLRKKGLEPA